MKVLGGVDVDLGPVVCVLREVNMVGRALLMLSPLSSMCGLAGWCFSTKVPSNGQICARASGWSPMYVPVGTNVIKIPVYRTNRVFQPKGDSGFWYGFNASNLKSISSISSLLNSNSEKTGAAGTLLPGPY